MRFSEAWLRESVNPRCTTQELVDQLTMAGLEVDSVEPAAAMFSGVLVGQVLEIQPHPDADRLKVCTVAVGGDTPLRIVCGASNVMEGMRVPAALVGAVLAGDFKIRKSQLRGVESFGMLCSTAELGLADEADGLMTLPDDAPVGKDIRDYLGLNDSIIEVDLTPNRADCLSVEGIAREVAVLNRMSWRRLPVEAVVPAHDDVLSVEVYAPEACPRYLGRLIKGVNPAAETPLWMQERLRRSGLRSLGPLIDVTNHVLLELGQPLHAFDAAKIRGGIQVRYGLPDEKLALLNDQEVDLDEDILVIADASKPLALAGVMGGLESAVDADTVDIFLECAFFAPDAIMGKARRYGLHTDSSHRFERGVDPDLQTRAIERATHLIINIAGGGTGPIVDVTETSALPRRDSILLRAERLKRLLGVTLAAEEVEGILRRLGMEVTLERDGWRVTPPSFRFDIAIEADLIEEIGRVYGYDNLPRRSMLMRASLAGAPETRLDPDRVKDQLVDRGYREAVTYSFVDEGMQRKITPDDEPLALRNPLSSELSVMRTSLWCGLIVAALRNVNRQQTRVRLFETGLRFLLRDDALTQEKSLAGLAMGTAFGEQWGEKARKIDFYDVKADVEAIIALTGGRVRFIAGKHPALHPGQSAEILSEGDQTLGWIGMLHPSLEKDLGFDDQVFLFELNQDRLLQRRVPSFRPLSKFPSVRRDLALLVDEDVTADQIRAAIDALCEPAIQEVIIFDVYRGQGVEFGKKSVALGCVIQDFSQTLTDSEIDAIVSRVLAKLAKDIKAKLRD
ncbi:MAG: phenylalanine--tRNA ligase subunit beta [Pseudomonadota bacterium]